MSTSVDKDPDILLQFCHLDLQLTTQTTAPADHLASATLAAVALVSPRQPGHKKCQTEETSHFVEGDVE